MSAELERLRQSLALNEKNHSWYADQIARQRAAIAAEEAREQAKAKYPVWGTKGYVIDSDGTINEHEWGCGPWARSTFDRGEWFTTREAAQRYANARDGLMALWQKGGMRLYQYCTGQTPCLSWPSKNDGGLALAQAFDALPPEQREAVSK